jgi:hypothetical protein
VNHKRGRSRRRRAGCKICKPWKLNGIRTESEGGEKFSDHRRRTAKEAEMTKENDAMT